MQKRGVPSCLGTRIHGEAQLNEDGTVILFYSIYVTLASKKITFTRSPDRLPNILNCTRDALNDDHKAASMQCRKPFTWSTKLLSGLESIRSPFSTAKGPRTACPNTNSFGLKPVLQQDTKIEDNRIYCHCKLKHRHPHLP